MNIRETGIIEKEILLPTKGESPPTGIKGAPAGKDKGEGKAKMSGQGRNPRNRDTKVYYHLDSIRKSLANALKGIGQDSIDKNKAFGKDFIRCGFDSQRTAHCRHKENAVRSELPPASRNNEKRTATVGASKRKPDTTDSEESQRESSPETPPAKKIKTQDRYSHDSRELSLEYMVRGRVWGLWSGFLVRPPSAGDCCRH